MPAVINPIAAPTQFSGATGTPPELVLQPGAVVDARVLAVRDNLARIVIAGLALEVLTEVALQPGANLKLAVSKTAEGVRLAIVTQQAPPQAQQGAPSPPGGSNAVSLNSTVAKPATAGAGTTAAAPAPRASASPVPLPANPEALALSRAVQASAPRQASLSPLFANLPVIVASAGVPQQVQSAASQLLASRPPLDSTLTADGLRQAFQKSGLFLEATLARGTAPAGAPDLKAALVVFRQVLANWLGQAAPSVRPSAAGPSQPETLAPSQNPAGEGPRNASVSTPTSNGTGAGLIRAQAIPGAGESPVSTPSRVASSAAPVAAAGELPELPGEAVRPAAQVLARDAPALRRDLAAPAVRDPVANASALPANPPAPVRPPAEPAPPFRGAVPSPQPIASPSLAPDASPASMGQRLLDQTDGALARQTLLQVASLPDRAEFGGANPNTQASQTSQPRWSFEIPFVTPQGTAVAQFEIERDGGGNEADTAAATRIWRARFTLDVEPTGPVHALVSLIGDKTAVRMWAERPETVARLRASTDALGLALREAELEPGDILVGEGAPPQPANPRAGRFLDRAT